MYCSEPDCLEMAYPEFKLCPEHLKEAAELHHSTKLLYELYKDLE